MFHWNICLTWHCIETCIPNLECFGPVHWQSYAPDQEIRTPPPKTTPPTKVIPIVAFSGDTTMLHDEYKCNSWRCIPKFKYGQYGQWLYTNMWQRLITFSSSRIRVNLVISEHIWPFWVQNETCPVIVLEGVNGKFGL